MDMNFGEPSNGMVCNCGEHHGVMDQGKKKWEPGQGWTPEFRAQVYAWFWDRNEKMFGGTAMTDNRKKYLKSWVNCHGVVYPNIGGFTYKSESQLRDWAGK